MKQEAEVHAAEDKEKQEMIELKNHAETLSYSAEKSLKDAGDKLPADIKTNVEAKISALKALKDSTDKAVLERAVNELTEEMMKIGDSMAKAQEPAAGASDAGQGGSQPDEGQIRDAEVK